MTPGLKPNPIIAGAGRFVLPGLFGLGAMHGYRSRVAGGQNPAFAAAVEGANFAGQFLLSPLTAGALFIGAPVAQMAGQAVVGSVTRHNNFIRNARTPFSARFEHSQASAQAMSNGLRAIGAGWSQAQNAAQASNYAARYGRR